MVFNLINMARFFKKIVQTVIQILQLFGGKIAWRIINKLLFFF
jgi:hypothetical protein